MSAPLIGDAPLPIRLQRDLTGLAVGCPAAYDLLPKYRCDTDTSDAQGVRRLSADDVVGAGADRDLAAAAAARNCKDLWSRYAGYDDPPLHGLS